MVCETKSINFNPNTDIPSLEGKVVLVTGANAGLGRQAVLQFARNGASQVWLCARNLEKARVAQREIQAELSPKQGQSIRLLQLDLNSFDSIKKASEKFKTECGGRLDILMLNAGVMATPAGTTADGYEGQFGTNHMGHALLTKLLLPILTSTAAHAPNADVRVVVLTSDLHSYAPKPDPIVFATLKSTQEELGSNARYGQSKLANILFARHLAHLYPQLTVASTHPGVVRTNLAPGATGAPAATQALLKMTRWLVATPEKGVLNQLWAATGRGVVSGEYHTPIGVTGNGTPAGKDPVLAARLWEWTERELDMYLAKA
jgi:retinol dehydrogenase 12